MYKKYIITVLWISIISGTFFFFFFGEERTFLKYFEFIAYAFIYSFPIAIGNWNVNKLLNKKFSWVEETKNRAIYGIIAIVLTNVIIVLACNYLIFVIINDVPIEDFFSEKYSFSNWITINVALLISAILHAKGFIEEWKKSTKKEVVEQKIIAKSANAQFESLKNQLDPHFLFNSLNVLSALIDESPNQAQRFTSSMSKIYRYVLDEKDKELVTVTDEIDFAKTYCELLKTRFEDSVTFDIEVGEKVKENFVVPLSLQLLLENAIKHNYATSQKPLNIKIFSKDGFLCVQNNLQAREIVKERDGIGLSNIVQRYSLITDRNVFIEKSPESFKVKVPILTEKINLMNTTTSNEEMSAYEKAAKRVEQLKGFYGNLFSFCIFIPFLFFINWKTSPEYWWAFWPLFGWGVGVISHAIGVFGIGKDWEEKQIQKYMDKEEEMNKKWK